ncbi:hypothetical protein PoB_004833300 [Plakobranchus ocellatus]|uniref:Uncharacterized protein n=1 Tax=Plakobranchus ocellatus TaxID=259542 RepID=A0AAV4BRS1_9GAST|nr:hypothetical protein PoB_004833300 [Plakobranchus ocellatus]
MLEQLSTPSFCDETTRCHTPGNISAGGLRSSPESTDSISGQCRQPALFFAKRPKQANVKSCAEFLRTPASVGGSTQSGTAISTSYSSRHQHNALIVTSETSETLSSRSAENLPSPSCHYYHRCGPLNVPKNASQNSSDTSKMPEAIRNQQYPSRHKELSQEKSDSILSPLEEDTSRSSPKPFSKLSDNRRSKCRSAAGTKRSSHTKQNSSAGVTKIINTITTSRTKRRLELISFSNIWIADKTRLKAY